MELPSGTITLLFTDIEGSTMLAERLGEHWPEVLAEHNRILREALSRHEGVELGSEGDALFAAFARASDAPGRGFHWGTEAHHHHLPRGERVQFDTIGTIEEILFGPSRVADGTMNLMGALRRSMATTGYTELKEFQRVEVVVG